MQNTSHDGVEKKEEKSKEKPQLSVKTTPKNPPSGNGRDHNVQPKPYKTNVEQ